MAKKMKPKMVRANKVGKIKINIKPHIVYPAQKIIGATGKKSIGSK